MTPHTKLRELRDTILERNHAGESLASIAADLYLDLGYASAHVAASKISRLLSTGGAEIAMVRPGPAPGSQANARFTPERLAELEAALQAGQSVWSFAGSRWEAWGFTSRSSCDSLFRKWLRTKVAA